MNRLIKRFCDKVVLSLAFTAAGSSAGWYWRQQAVIRGLQREPVRAVLAGPAYVAEQWPLPQTPVALWSKPPVQSRGGGWFYEEFSPPPITYNAVARKFAVTPPLSSSEPVGEGSGLELLAVRREPYRLQLLGYFGEPGDYVAAFSSSLLPETLLARPGHRFEALGLTLKSFAVRQVAVKGGELGQGFEVAALAVLLDETAGIEVTLDSRTRKLTDTLLAVFKTSGVPGESGEYHEGDTFAGEGGPFRVERIEFDPAEVMVARTSSGLPNPEKSILRTVNPMPGKGGLPKALAPRTTSDVAAANP